MSHSIIKLDINQEVCEDQKTIKWSRHLWIHIIVLILASVSLYLLLHNIYITYYNYLKFHERYVKPNIITRDVDSLTGAMEFANEKNISYREKQGHKRMTEDAERLVDASFIAGSGHSTKKPQIKNEQAKALMDKHAPKSWISNWSLMVLISNLFQICSVLVFIVDHRKRIGTASIFMGFGSFFSWVSILRYFQYDANYFFMFNSILTSSSNVIRYLLGALLIFFGYGFFASSVFWRSHRYESTTRSMQIQFALLDGDSIYDTFADLTRFHFALGQLYLYTFIIMFICVVQNLFVSMIQKVYSDYRKDETKSIIEKEKLILIEENKRKEAEKEDKADPKLILKAQMEGIMEHINALQTQFELQTKNIPLSDKEEIANEYNTGINALKKLLAELEQPKL